MYFVANPDGSSKFAKELDEQNANVSQYRQQSAQPAKVTRQACFEGARLGRAVKRPELLDTHSDIASRARRAFAR